MVAPALCLLVPLLFSVGCNKLRQRFHETVYVSARQVYLHDRVAAVSNRVGEVTNGQPLQVLEHGRRFLKVKTAKNEIGWIEEHAVIDQKSCDAFNQIGEQHKNDPVVATGVLRDDIYLHLTPGRDTERFFLLPGNSKVQLLVRASVVKAASNVYQPNKPTLPKPVVPKPAAPAASAKPSTQAAGSAKNPAKPVVAKQPSVPEVAIPALPTPEPPPLEDWWLVRDSQGRSGWMLAKNLDVDVPEEIGLYAEGQRIVGAYVLNKVMDPEANTPNHEVPQYLTVLSPPKSGLPCDFDQVRLFTWSLKRHRYETAFRLHPIQGFLPVKVWTQSTANGSAPVFSFQIANGNVWTDSATGIGRASSLRTIQYMLADTQAKRIGADQGPIPVMHSGDGTDPNGGKNGKNAKGKKKR